MKDESNTYKIHIQTRMKTEVNVKSKLSFVYNFIANSFRCVNQKKGNSVVNCF